LHRLDDPCIKIYWLHKVLDKLFNSQNLSHDLEEHVLSGNPYRSGQDGYTAAPIYIIIIARNVQKKTLLHIASQTNDEKAVDILFEFNHDYLERNLDIYDLKYRYYQPISIDAIDFQGNTPLHFVSEKGYDAIVSLFLRKGAIFNSKNNQDQTPEQLANNSYHNNVVKLFQSTKNLFIAIEHNNLKEVKNCIKEGEYINVKDEKGKTPLHIASFSGQTDIVQYLLKMKANIEAVDINNLTPLHLAATNDEIEIVKLLLKKGASYNVKNQEDKVSHELKENQSIILLNEIDKLFNGVQSDNPQVVIEYFKNIYKKYNIDINNIRDIQGNTILHYAAESNYYDIVEFLLKNGAIFNATNKLNKTAESIIKHQDTINLLKSINEMFESTNSIYQKEKKVNMQIITNVRNNEGMTLLHRAVKDNNLKVVKWLVKKGANTNFTDNNDNTPLDLAGEQNHKEIIEYLKPLTNAGDDLAVV
jgi:ankyrin repeat protein